MNNFKHGSLLLVSLITIVSCGGEKSTENGNSEFLASPEQIEKITDICSNWRLAGKFAGQVNRNIALRKVEDEMKALGGSTSATDQILFSAYKTIKPDLDAANCVSIYYKTDGDKERSFIIGDKCQIYYWDETHTHSTEDPASGIRSYEETTSSSVKFKQAELGKLMGVSRFDTSISQLITQRGDETLSSKESLKSTIETDKKEILTVLLEYTSSALPLPSKGEKTVNGQVKLGDQLIVLKITMDKVTGKLSALLNDKVIDDPQPNRTVKECFGFTFIPTP